MQFRSASAEEFEAVMAIIEDGRASLAGLGIDQWQNGSPNAQMVQADLAAGSTMVAVENGKPIGTLSFVTTGEPDYARPTFGSWLSDRPSEGEAEADENRPSGGSAEIEVPVDASCDYVTIHRVAVAARAAKRGVASFMMQSAIELAQSLGFRSVRVDTHEGNIPMQRMLQKNGFRYCCDIELSTPDEPTKKRLGYEILLP